MLFFFVKKVCLCLFNIGLCIYEVRLCLVSLGNKGLLVKSCNNLSFFHYRIKVCEKLLYCAGDLTAYLNSDNCIERACCRYMGFNRTALNPDGLISYGLIIPFKPEEPDHCANSS